MRPPSASESWIEMNADDRSDSAPPIPLELSAARSNLLKLLHVRVLESTERDILGYSTCGLLCDGGSESRGCSCDSPNDCPLRNKPEFEKYRTNFRTFWFTPMKPGVHIVQMNTETGEMLVKEPK